MKKSNTTNESKTDWARIDAMKDEDIDFSDLPEVSPEMFARGVLRKNFKPIPKKSQENLLVDRDIIEFFKAQGQNYQVKINQLLRAYMEAHDNK